ncbi:MAG TPA: hypothetical protein VNJ29_00330, partial [Candidatus Nitrosotenuis sp.]|nr:hypothetical protein [Candidatus Nitrosotenuis sp.]
MKHLRFLVLSGILYLGSSPTPTIAMEHHPYSLETFEKGMLKRALKSHLTYHEDDWREVCHASKGRLYGINEDIARLKFQEKAKNLENVYYEIFYDPSNPDRENAKIIAGLQAKLMLRNYYNQQCQNIILAYPKKYSAYSYTIPESHLIYILESLAYKLQEDMLRQLKWIQESRSISVDLPLIKTIEANPLTDEYHKTFELQLKEIQRVGADEYLKRLEKAAEDRAKTLEKYNREQTQREQERMKNIPIPPPPPTDYKVIPYKDRRAMLMT